MVTDYNLSYAICSLLYLLVVALHYFQKRRYPSIQNRLFAVLLVVAALDIALDVSGSYVMMNEEHFPTILNYIINIPFYILQIVVLAIMLLYVVAVAGKYTVENRCWLGVLLIPAALIALCIATTPVTHLFFYAQGDIYSYGPAFMSIYVISFAYMLMTLLIAINYRSCYTRSQFWTIIMFLLSSIVAVAIQFFNPAILLTSLAISMSITMMSFTMQAPADLIDFFTSVYNKEAFFQYVDGAYTYKNPTRVIVITLDSIYNLSDTLGARMGGELEKAIASSLWDICEKAWVFRISDGKYAIATSDYTLSLRLQDAIKKRLNDKWSIGNTTFSVPYTVCAINDVRDVAPAARLLRLFSIASDKAKKRGTHICLDITSSEIGELERYIAIETGLGEALIQEKLGVYYQPIYSLAEKRFLSVEALVRYEHPTLGSISPAEFIPLAEGTGLVVSLDKFMLKSVCRMIKRENIMERFGLDIMEVNLSAVDLMQDNLHVELVDIINNEGVPLSNIGFEITESAAAIDAGNIALCLHRLSERGLRLFLDDFGSGYGNISRVSNLPLYAVKLDKSLMDGIVKNRQNSIVFADTVRMCKRLGFKVTVEGVETSELLPILEDAEVDEIQGFFFAKPMPEAEFIRFMERVTEIQKD